MAVILQRLWTPSYTQHEANASIMQVALLPYIWRRYYFCHFCKIANPIAPSLCAEGQEVLKRGQNEGMVQSICYLVPGAVKPVAFCTKTNKNLVEVQRTNIKQSALQGTAQLANVLTHSSNITQTVFCVCAPMQGKIFKCPLDIFS